MRVGRLSLVANLSHPGCKAIGGADSEKKAVNKLGDGENMDEHMLTEVGYTVDRISCCRYWMWSR